MAPWGRPLDGVARNKRKAGYERQMREWEESQRLQELDSDEDGQGVGLGTDYGRGFVGDELQYTGFDIGYGMHRRTAYDDQYGDDYDFLDEEDDYEGRTGGQRQLAMRHKEELVVQRALERIHRARLMGKANVNLSREELDALQRRGLHPQQPQQSQQPHPQRDLPISRTPVKAKERKTSIGSATGDRSSKRTGRGFFPSPAAKPKAAKQNRKGTPSSDENTPSYDPAAAPGFIIPGPGGMPSHTPLGYYAPTYYSTPSPSRRDSPTNSHSASAARRQNNTPPGSSQYIAYRSPGRYFSQPDNFRPSTSSSRGAPTRARPAAPDGGARSRSASAANIYPEQSAYQPRPYNAPISTGSTSRLDNNRRHVSGPAEVSYSTLRRVPPSVGMSKAGASDPALLTRTSSGLSQQMDVDDSSSDEDDEDQGVQVEIVPDDMSGYSVRGSTGGGGAPVSGGGGRQRRGKR